ncbi:ABC transporter permease [Paenibacillus ehimensis]|uniref:FtsX-like permease family protein n=1 Tax=Paenibacillus ehimensis TaxID=79264 RepID=A0ABT8V3W1_9BACL|nr:FtsX-like permease family protein [Paenibacillus ehimensis]MDO3675423.1 FtsX-like permease family protein [Paenibacillus ehimensis]
MTRLTLFELVTRSMRKNIKHYYLYFFALIFSTSLYFVFATLQHDSSIARTSSADMKFAASFQVAGILLLLIVAVFTVYANRIFLKRRSREIGLYQLIGLTRKGVARFLIIENVLLGAGALLAGIGSGALVARLFLLILMKLLGFEGFIELTFSAPAALQTVIVFAALIVLTSIQMLLTVYRSTLLQLFHADQQGEHPKKPNSAVAAFLALLGIALIGFGYWLSGHMVNDMLFFNMLLVLLSTILGTYLLFRVTIGWAFYLFRKSKDGHLGLANSLSLAPLMHRMKANANSLTLITVLSAMTLTMVAMSYSLYFSAESDTRISLPYDFIFENNGTDSRSFSEELQKEGITFVHKPVEAVRLMGKIRDPDNRSKSDYRGLLFLPAEQLLEAGTDIKVPGKGEAVLFDGRANLAGKNKEEDKKFPQEIEPGKNGGTETLRLTGLVVKFAMNFNVYGAQLVTDESTFKELRESMRTSPDFEAVRFDTYLIPDKKERAKASGLYVKYTKEDRFMPDFHTQYEATLQTFGLLIFISGFLGLVFLISTGSILYFKQMTEAEQEKRSFVTLRQLGFDVNAIMRGIVRKQLFVFAIPLLIGLVHSVFAVKAASILALSSIVVPSAIAMGVYALIYFVFAVLTIGYYKKIVKHAM